MAVPSYFGATCIYFHSEFSKLQFNVKNLPFLQILFYYLTIHYFVYGRAIKKKSDYLYPLIMNVSKAGEKSVMSEYPIKPPNVTISWFKSRHFVS